MIVTADKIRKEIGGKLRRSGRPNGRAVDVPSPLPPAPPSTVAVRHVTQAVSSRRHVHSPDPQVGTQCVVCWGWVDDWRHTATDAAGNVTAHVGR